ncbi:MAG: ferrochelatase [Chloroflexi bacterium]|nr:ferrochelatase [Chloroflexota bacterium]
MKSLLIVRLLLFVTIEYGVKRINMLQTPSHSPDTRIGVLLAQLGTPDAPTSQALRRYLAQFLSDRRVVDYNPILWWALLHLLILNMRPRRSATLYQRIWLPEGSPLLVHSQAQATGLQNQLGDAYHVILGMRYGNPSVAEAMRSFRNEGVDRLLVLPIFPQFSAATTGSIYDAITEAVLRQRRRMPTLRFVPPYYAHPGYIQALKATIEETVKRKDEITGRYLFSFHGLPQRYIDEGDPYREQCQITAHLLGAALGLDQEQWMVSFQSRFGREKWLQPYTDETLKSLGKQEIDNLVVACPGFTADCLETLDEIGNEGYEIFKAAGGQTFWLAPCLNAHPAWLDALADIVRQETLGWM